jgi:hypothetical protein
VLPTDVVESGDGVGSGEVSGVLPWPAETVGDVLVDSAAAVGLAVPLLVDWLGAVPAARGEDELWVVFLVRNDMVDGAVCDPRDFCDEGDGPLEAPSEVVLGAVPPLRPSGTTARSRLCPMPTSHVSPR